MKSWSTASAISSTRPIFAFPQASPDDLMTHHVVLDRLALHAPAFAQRMRELLDRGGVDLSFHRLEDQ